MAIQKASDKYKELKKEVSRLSSMANKRLRRLEKNDLTNLPAYRSWAENGSIKFGVKGKDYNQLQSEYWRLQHFLDDRTSTVREAHNYIREIAANTGIKYKNLKHLKKLIPKFFELVGKIERYNTLVKENANYLDYQRIWQQINRWIDIDDVDLSIIDDSEQALNMYLNKLDKVIEIEENKEGFKDADMDDYDFIEI